MQFWPTKRLSAHRARQNCRGAGSAGARPLLGPVALVAIRPGIAAGAPPRALRGCAAAVPGASRRSVLARVRGGVSCPRPVWLRSRVRGRCLRVGCRWCGSPSGLSSGLAAGSRSATLLALTRSSVLPPWLPAPLLPSFGLPSPPPSGPPWLWRVAPPLSSGWGSRSRLCSASAVPLTWLDSRRARLDPHGSSSAHRSTGYRSCPLARDGTEAILKATFSMGRN